MCPTANLGNPYIHLAPRVFIPNSRPKKGTCDFLSGWRTSELLMPFSLSGLVTPGRFSGQEVRSSHSADGSMTIAESEIILAAPGFFCRRRWVREVGVGNSRRSRSMYSRYDPTRRKQRGRRIQGSFYLSSNLRLSTWRMILDATQKKIE
jgi:hypothetical protein